MSDTHPCRCEVSTSLGIWWLVPHSLSWAPVHLVLLFFRGYPCLLSCRCSQVPSWLTELTEHALSRWCLPFSWCEVLITPLVLIPSHTPDLPTDLLGLYSCMHTRVRSSARPHIARLILPPYSLSEEPPATAFRHPA